MRSEVNFNKFPQAWASIDTENDKSVNFNMGQKSIKLKQSDALSETQTGTALHLSLNDIIRNRSKQIEKEQSLKSNSYADDSKYR